MINEFRFTIQMYNEEKAKSSQLWFAVVNVKDINVTLF